MSVICWINASFGSVRCKGEDPRPEGVRTRSVFSLLWSCLYNLLHNIYLRKWNVCLNFIWPYCEIRYGEKPILSVYLRFFLSFCRGFSSVTLVVGRIRRWVIFRYTALYDIKKYFHIKEQLKIYAHL
jgi:hypothetical protein